MLLALLCLRPATAAPVANIIPVPRLVRAMAGPPVRIADDTVIATPPGDREAADVADYLAHLALQSRGLRLRPRAGRVGAIVLARGTVPGGAEAYALDVGNGRVRITAATRAGLLYGAVSAWQLLTADAGHGPALLAPTQIEDAPRYRWRGLLLDSARHFQSTAGIARTLDWMAWHKLNVLQWHLTDDQGWRLSVDGYPRLTSVGAFRTGRDGARYGGFYTQAEVRALVALAARRNITIVPEVEMPGHALSAILAYPELGFAGLPDPAKAQGDWGVFPSIYGVDEHTFGFLETVLDQVMALFPSRTIAIGGDEAVKDAWAHSPAVQARMKALGLADEAALQAWFIRRIGAYLAAHNRRHIGWDEIVQGGAPPGATVLWWHGPDGERAAVAPGHDVVMATAPTLYFDNRQSTLPDEPPGRGLVVGLRDVYDFDPGDPARHIVGLQAQLWTEHIQTDARIEAMALPRAAALAEVGWSTAENRDWAGFVARLPAQFARYRALGLKVDEGAIGVAVGTWPDFARGTVRVSLANQIGLGDLRYTTDGSAPSAAAARYDAPFAVPLATHLRAATFVDGARVSSIADRVLDAQTLRHRTSQEMRLCTEKVPLNLEGRARGTGPRPLFLVDIKNPCWIYPAADLTNIGSITAGVAALPFNYQLGDEAKQIVLTPAATPEGELLVRLNGCEGSVIATLPLGGIARDGTQNAILGTIPPRTGTHDLCFRFTARQLDPMWALGWVQLRPSSTGGGAR